MKKIAVLGAGTWGMALARMLSNSGNDVMVWSAIPSEIDRMMETHTHPNLPGMIIPEMITYTKSVEEICKDKDILLMAVPSVFVRSTIRSAAPFIPDGQVIVDVAKGLEAGTLFTMSEVIRDEIAKDGKHDNVKVVALSGPTHAEEVAKDIPTTIVSACEDPEIAKYVQTIFSNTCMRTYTNTDVKGVEICGALKNVIALAAGVSDGLGFGDNTKAALITRGIAEIARLGLAMGCNIETFLGLAGIGDLIVTATSVHSRNHRAGEYMGKGMEPAEAVRAVGMVVEGVNAIPAAIQLAELYHVDMPIVQAADAIVNKGAKPLDMVIALMNRDLKVE